MTPRRYPTEAESRVTPGSGRHSGRRSGRHSRRCGAHLASGRPDSLRGVDARTGLPVVGMIGAGQLARMTQQAAIALGQSLRVLAESSDDGAALVVADVMVGDYRDLDDLRRFAAGCDVLTFDHEHVPTQHIE